MGESALMSSLCLSTPTRQSLQRLTNWSGLLIALAAVMIVVFGFVAFSLVRSIGGQNGGNGSTLEALTTPTNVPYAGLVATATSYAQTPTVTTGPRTPTPTPRPPVPTQTPLPTPTATPAPGTPTPRPPTPTPTASRYTNAHQHTHPRPHQRLLTHQHLRPPTRQRLNGMPQEAPQRWRHCFSD